jgi:alkanesulfonate monooxygenase SsuD/methylene tetrahydromethanopterin reductase-like flavin-dependent oxidoreductase (luciferase family)
MPSRRDRTLLIGISAVLHGRLADPEAVRTLALAAEQLGYSSLWISDGPLSGDGGAVTTVPSGEDTLDPLTALANTAAVTSRVRLGTRVAVDPGRGAAAGLVRALRSVDRLSDGRLTVAVGLTGGSGWDQARRGWDGLDGLDAGPSPLVLVTGADPLVGPAGNGLAGPALVDRVDGWLATGVDLDTLAERWAVVRARLGGAGPDRPVRLVVHAPVVLGPPADDGRRAFHGDLDQIVGDLDVVREAGAGEVVLGLPGDPGLDEALDIYARVAETVEARR